MAIAVPTGSPKFPFSINILLKAFENTLVSIKYKEVYVLSVHCQQNENRNTVIIIVLALGTIIVANVRKTPAPSIYAASSSVTDSERKFSRIR